MAEPLTFFLPYPPSANNLFFTNWKTKRRPISKEYEAWKADAGKELNGQATRPTCGPVRVLYEYHKPDNRRRDVCNLEKAVTDLLVDHKLIDDDSLIWEATLRWTREHPGKVKVTVTSFEPPDAS